MEKKQSMKKKRSRVFALLGILTALVLSCTVLQGEPEEMHAACTQNCGTCGGSGYTTSYYSNRSGTYVGGTNSGFVSGYSYGSYTIMRGCTTCGGSSDRTTYWKNSNCTGESISIGNVTKGSGKVSKACTWPGANDWTYETANGRVDTTNDVPIANGKRVKKCTKCKAVLQTQYLLELKPGTGISSTSGGGYYDVNASGIKADCTVKTGYTFLYWSDYDTNKSWTTTMNMPKVYTATATPNSYTQTMNHYLYNPDTSGWDYWTTTTAPAAYDSVFYPSYTSTPSGYYNYSLDWSGGWTVSGAGTFCAYYYPNTYSVSYNANGGSGAPSSHNFVYNSTAYLSWTQPTRAGYTFSHWTVNENGATMSPGQQIPKGWGSFSLTAQWTANQYDLTVNPNGGAFADGTTAAKTADPKLTYDAASWWNVAGFVPARTGYTFEGFYDALEGGTKVYDATGACVPQTAYWNGGKQYVHAGNLTVYARWSENEYTVTYDANGGETATQTKTFHYNEKVDLSPVATKAGKIFVGWSTEPDAQSAMHTFVMPDLATSDNPDHADWEITLYAVYSIAVSDVANHTYPDYDEERKKEQEVFVRVYDGDNLDNYRDYELSYTGDTNTMVYRYTVDTDITDFVRDKEKYFYAIYAYDNAGNWSVIHSDWVYMETPPDEPEPEPEIEDPTIKTYCQTVEHYRYDAIKKKWEKCFSDTRIEVKEGEWFTPSHLTPPTGYHKTDIKYPDGYVEAGKITDGSYKVTEDTVNRVYYEPNTYTLTFDANGGTITAGNASVNEIAGRISYDARYGMVGFDYDADGVYTDAVGFPTPEKVGYTFTGWYTQSEGGEVIESSGKYETDGDTTLYAHWQINSYTVIYDYWTNGGTDAAIYQKAYDYESSIDLSVEAQKSGSGLSGWTHIGWNTDADATTGLTELVIGDKDVVLYAIYQKDISVTQIDQTNSGTKTMVQTKRIYNKADKAEFILEMAAGNTWTGWEHLGWTTETGAEELPLVGPGGTYRISENTTVYSVYESSVTLSHDTNGSTMLYEPQTKACYYNAAGNSSYPFFMVASAPVLSRHSFVRWNIIAGTVIDADANQPTFCMPADVIQLQTDATLEAVWDKHPVIEAYSRYFTLEQARNGEITQEKLLEKVIATDEEAKSATNPDGVLENGVDVVVKNYNASDFTGIIGDKTISITYEATDSFGNVVTKTVSITIVDTTVKKSNKVRYIRFISSRFYADDTGSLLAPEKGGLELTSVWRNNDSYKSLLESSLYNKKLNEEYKTIEYFGTSTEVKIAGSGTWQNQKSTWVFTKDDIEEVKEFVDTHGYGNIRESNALELFIEAFRKCLKLN